MAFSKSEATALVKAYREKFGFLPEGLAKQAANQGEFDKMYDGMKWALDNGKLPNWSDYVTPFEKRSEPVSEAA